MESNGNAIESIYARRVEQFLAEENRLARRERMVMNLRVAAFILAAAMFGLAWKSEYAAMWCLAGIASLVIFFAAVVYHDRVRRQLHRCRLLREINQQAIARLHRDWSALPETVVGVPAEHRATADDLDLFGHASLFHFLNQANTPFGIRTMRDWLLQPAMPDEIERRQQAARELAPHLELRHSLILEVRLLADRGKSTERFVEWAEREPWLAARPWLLWWCRISSATIFSLFILSSCGVLPLAYGWIVFLAMFCINAMTITIFGGQVHDSFSPLSRRSGEAARFVRLFELMYTMPDSSGELDVVKREATRLGGGVIARMRQLKRIVALASLRHNMFLTVFVYLPLQFIFLYDFHALNLLETWQIKYGKFARRWFLALGKFESLCSLAAVVHDQPQWTMPKVEAAADRFLAHRLGHPLLPSETCVANDVEIGPAGSFLLVTGSNMSGKSTLLRAIGVNAVLAQAGSAACAESFSMPPSVLATSMRVRDSLEAGVSFYMAELMRLKEIVDLAREANREKDRMLLYILDEILLGTNSKERHIAVERVLQHLLHCRSIGAISTHDLDLAASESLAVACRCSHFRETLHDRNAEKPMTFDYKLRPGIATTTNALKLLEIVGLNENDGKQ